MSAADFETWGIGHYQIGQNAFQAVPPKAKVWRDTAPKKRGPKLRKTKVQQAAMALETHDERQARQFKERQQKAIDQQGRATVDMAPRTAGAITIHNRADAAKTSRIKQGRSI